MKLFTPFTIPHKDNCDLCRIEKNSQKVVENPFIVDYLKTSTSKDSISYSTNRVLQLKG